MSLDNIQLPPIVLQELFKHSLVELNLQQEKGSADSSGSLPFLGNNARRILIIVEDNDAIYLPDDQLNFLLGVLSACKLTMADVAIFNIKKYSQANYKLLSKQFQPEKLLLFGVPPDRIGLSLDFPCYQIQQFNSQTYLTAPGLMLLQNDKTEKMKLWNCLKQIFDV